MKKAIAILLACVMIFALAGCCTQSENQDTYDIDISTLSQGDEVSIIGQKANSTLVNDKTIWVQVVKGEQTIVYYCQLKDEYLGQGESLEILDIVKVKGYYLSTMDLKQENTAIIVNLYDCEILE